MAEPIDKAALGTKTDVELLEGGKVLITDTSEDPFLPTFLNLDALAATRLFDFLLLHMNRLNQHAQGQKVAEYNREMDARNRIIAESRDKPWLPLHDGE